MKLEGKKGNAYRLAIDAIAYRLFLPPSLNSTFSYSGGLGNVLLINTRSGYSYM